MDQNQRISVSVVMPCLNEEEGVGICVEKAIKALRDLDISGEVIVVDNGSTDKSIAIAQQAGARVVVESERGYGSAYQRGFREAQGDIIIMGDADNSYDFSQIGDFIKLIREGYDFVLGSRFKGNIMKGAMPWANRYIGNPILSGILRLFFKTNVSDAHSGMRSFTKEALSKMKLHSLGMEFASEMVVAALREHLKIKEIPIHYHVREGDSKLNPFRDAWRHFSFMLIYSPTWLYFVPGLLLFVGGVIALFALLYGPIEVFGHMWDIHIMILASLAAILGVQVIMLGLFARTFGVRSGFLLQDRTLEFLWKYFSLEKGIAVGIIIFTFGFVFNLLIVREWIGQNFGPLERVREAILGVTFINIGIQMAFSSFFLHMLGMKVR